jgi:hypothetical protein
MNSLPVIGNKFTFGIDGGLSVPARDFSSSSLIPSSSNSNVDGSAKMGSCYDIYAGFKFLKHIGIMAQYGANNNSFNISGFNSTINGNYTSSGGYVVTGYLLGPYFSIKILKVKIEAKLLGGLVSSNYPTLSSGSTLNGVTSSVVTSFSTGNGFGYGAGAKIKYMMIGGMLGIGLGLDYLGSIIEFKGINNTESISNLPTISNSYNAKMGIGIIQATLGLSLDI